MTFTAGHGRRRTAAQADQHRRATQHDQPGTGAEITLVDMLFTNIAVAAGEHDGLVIAAYLFAGKTRCRELKAAEVAAQVGAPELVVEGRAANRAFQHDIQRADDPSGLAVICFPGLGETRDMQIGHGKSGEAHLRL